MEIQVRYRIEHEDGYGPFATRDENENYREYCAYEQDDLSYFVSRYNISFPTAREEGHVTLHDYEFFAFNSINTIIEWTTSDEMKILISLGYRVYELELEECKTYSMQTVFLRSYIQTKTDITDKILCEY